jgi:hypothetical protein
MTRIFKNLALTAWLVAALAGCDGGSSGTGISTTALGNVASVSTALRPAPGAARPTMVARLLGWFEPEHEALALGPLEDIRVSIEGTTLSTQTDSQGQFQLRGDFAGPVPMIFELPDGGRASLVIVVPRGGELTLTNVHLDKHTGIATAANQHVQFGGLVNETNCAGSSATMVSDVTPTDGNTYTVLLNNATVQDQSGNSLGCANLSAGQSANVDGEVQSDGAVQAQSVEIEHEPKNGGSGSSGDGGVSGSGSGHNGSDTGGGDNGGKSGSNAEGGSTSSGEGGASSGEGSTSGGDGTSHN